MNLRSFIFKRVDEKPKFVIPAQKATAHAFNGEWPTAIKNKEDVDRHSDNESGFPIYNYEDVVRASNSYYQKGIGGVGLSYEKNISGKTIMVLLILGTTGILSFSIVKRKKQVNK